MSEHTTGHDRRSDRSGAASGAAERGARTRDRLALDVLRYLLPACVVAGGLVVIAFGSEADLEGGAGIISAGLAIYFVNWLFRIGVQGERERDAEDAARDYFERHGHWPDQRG